MRSPHAPAGSEVSLFQMLPVVEFVPGNHIGQGAHGNFVLVGHTPTSPVLGAQVAKQGQRRGTNSFEFLHQVGEPELGIRAIAHIVVLLITLDRRTDRCARNGKRDTP